MSNQSLDAIQNEYFDRKQNIVKGFDALVEVEAFKDFSRGVLTMAKINNNELSLLETSIEKHANYLKEYLVGG